jgi:hypothetical protein
MSLQQSPGVEQALPLLRQVAHFQVFSSHTSGEQQK